MIQVGFFVSWPGVMIENVTKYFPKPDKTQEGHVKQIIMYNLQNLNLNHNIMQWNFLPWTHQLKHHDVYFMVCGMREIMIPTNQVSFLCNQVKGVSIWWC